MELYKLDPKKWLYTVLTLLSLLPVPLFAQLDKTHYIPPMYGREDFGCHYIVLSTPSATPFTVTITDGSGTVIATPSISSTASTTIPIGCTDTTAFLVAENQLNTVMTDKGLILTAAESFYVNLRVLANPQGGSLTSKGFSASRGQDFRTGHIFNNNGHGWRKSNTFSFIATENNTTVNVTDITPGVVFFGTTPAGAPLTSPNVTVTLNAGESYVMAAYVDDPQATQNLNGVNGTRITSDKPIIVNSGSWLGGNSLTGAGGTFEDQGRDLGIDQIVPADKVGDEYVLIKGEGIDNEKTFVIATQNGTDIMLDGNPTPVATINAGDYYLIDGTQFSANDNLYLQTSAPVFVYQSSNGSDGTTDDNERQNGLNFLPPVGCNGSKDVRLPDVDFIGTAYINIIADAGANVFVNGALQGPGDPVTGTTDYETHKLTAGYTGDVHITSDKLTRVALINLSGNVGANGYFSGFSKDVSVTTNTVNGDNIALEGCIQASFTFSLDEPASGNTDVTFQIGGTAVNGIDYAYVDSILTIPAGQTNATIFIDAILDGLTEGQESIFIIYQPEPCAPVDTAFLYIDDAQPIDFSLDGTDLLCHEDSTGVIIPTTTGGFPPYEYHVTDSLGNTDIYTTDPIPNMPAGEYVVQVYDSYGCKAEALVVGGQFNAGQTFLPDGSGVSYTSTLAISGFDAGATLNNMSQLQQICANMEHSYLGDLQIRIISPSGQSAILKQFAGGGSCDLGEPIATAPVDGAASSTLTDPGIGYDYCWNDNPVYGTMVGESNNYTRNYTDGQGNNYTDNYLPQGSYDSFDPLSNLLGSTLNGNWTIEVTDQYSLDNGYIFYWNISLASDLPDSVVVLEQPDGMDINGLVSQANCGGSDGSINITVTGDHDPFTFNWSNGATTEDLINIPAGTYEVIVTDTTGCSDSSTYLLNNISSINISSNISQVECSGGANGAIDITISGGTAPYTVSWDNGATSEDISGLTAGDYTVTITDDNGCTYSELITVTEIPGIQIDLISSSDEICGTMNGAIDISVSGGSGSYGYAWSSGQSSQDISSLAGGSYDVTVTDGNGCTANATFTITNNVSNCSSFCYLDIVANQVDDDQCGSGVGAIDISITNVTNPFNLSWSNGATSEDISGLSAGSYTVTVNDASGCSATETIVVNNNTGNLNVSNSNVFNETCGNGLGSIDITVSGGTLPYSFNWSNGATTEDISGLSAGTYNVDIIDGIGCVLSQSFTVNNNTGSLIYSSAIVDDTCSATIGEIDLSVSGGNSPYTYLWSNGATSQDLSNLSAGSFTCTITDASGCELITPLLTVDNTSGSLSLISTVVTNENCGDGMGEIDITVAGGSTPYTFNWSNGATTEDITGLSAGTFDIDVTDDNGCTVSASNITVFNAASTLAVNTNLITDEICGNGQGSINVDVTGGSGTYTFSWSNGSTSEDLYNVAAGQYTLLVDDGAGCSTTYSGTINNTSGTLSNSNIIVTYEVCGNSNGAVDVVNSGGQAPFTYLWSNGATTEDITGVAAGFYTCDITDANGCSITVSATVNNNASGLSETHIATSEICSNGMGAVDLTVSGGTAPYTFNWSNGATTEDISGLSAGVYSCTITDDNGCSIATGNVTVINNSSTLNASSIVLDEDCNNGSGSIDLSVTGGTSPYSFSWNSGQTTEDITGLSAGTYICTISDANGCVTTHTATVNNNPGTLSLDNSVITNELCNNDMGAIDISVSGGTAPVTFSWSNGATTEDITGLDQGSYSVTITDVNGCQIVSSAMTVANNAGTLSLDNVIAYNEQCGNGGGAIDITVSGGTAPYIFNWSNGATTEDVYSLSAGNYTCTITDQNGCSVQANASVLSGSSNLQVISSLVTDEACGNGAGIIDIEVSGGTPGYTYSWSEGSSSQDISGLSAGTYTVQITDQNGCSLTHNATVNNTGASLAITSYSINDEICGNGQGAIDITINGGSSPYSYVWSNGASSEDLSGLSAGTYNVTIADANGCSVQGNYTVNLDNGGLVINSLVVTDENCGNGLGEIDMTYVNGAPDTCCTYTLNMYDGNNNGWGGNPIPEVMVYLDGTLEGAYSVPVGGGNSLQTELISVCNGQTLEIEYVPGQANNNNSYDLYDNNNNLLFADGPGPAGPGIAYTTTVSCPVTYPPVTISWSNGANTEDITGLSAGNYSVTITDQFGCSVSDNANVNNVSGGFAATVDNTTDETCGDGSGAIDISVTGGTAPYTVSWDNGASTEDIAGLSAGTYVATIIDDNGCSIVIDTTIINVSTGVTISNAFIQNENCSDSTGFIDLTISGGTTPYTFLWSNGATTEDAVALTSGSYTCTITDNSGCSITYSGTVSNNASGMTNSSTIIDAICTNNNGSIEVVMTSGSGPFTYSWSSGTPVSSCCDYTLDMVDAGNSWNGASVDVFVDGSFVGNYTVPGGGANTEIFPVCNGETIELFFNSGAFDNELSFDLLDASGNIVFSQGPSPTPGLIYTGNAVCPGGGNNTTGITDLTSGNYNLTITDNVGCVLTQTYTVNAQNNANLDFANITIIDDLCTQSLGEVSATGTGGSSYTYAIDNGTPQFPGVFSGLASANYLVSVFDENGCQFDSSVFVDDVIAFTIVIDSAYDENCDQANGAIYTSVSPAGTYTYSWSNGGTSDDITGLAAGAYTLTVSGSGCVQTISTSLINIPAFTASGVSTDEFCSDSTGTIDMTVTGGSGNFTFDWSNGANTEDLSGLTSGLYELIISDNDEGCTDTLQFTIGNTSNGMMSSAIAIEDTCLSGVGEIDATISGGSGSYAYSWSNGATTEDISGLTSGVFELITTDLIDGCTDTVQVTVGNITNGMSDTAIVVNDSCNQMNGSIDVTVSGGSGNYDYSWSTGDTSEDLAGVGSGSYTVTITDLSDGCQLSSTYMVSNIGSIGIASNVLDASCSTCNDGAIDISITGSPTLPITYTWSNGASTQDATGLLPGTYIVTATDANGCSVTDTIEVSFTVGLESIVEGWEVSIYPNPSNQIFTIDFEINETDNVQMSIHDLRGRLIENRTIAPGTGNVQFDLSGQTNGVYSLRLSSSGKTANYRLVLIKR